ncbi:MAG TPA: sulfatase [Candidatus Limnocylindrales bacterium]|nr:sulfatase [Candidatus Limnocylindrales bacterium]
MRVVYRPGSARIALFPVAAVLLAATACPARGDLDDAALIQAAASEAASQSRLLAEKAGPGYQAQALEKIRRSCASRGVVRLDEIEPASVKSEAAAAGSHALYEIDFRAHPATAGAATARIAGAGKQKQDEYTLDERGLELRGGIRTEDAFAIARDSIGTIEIEIETSARSYVLVGWSRKADTPRIKRNSARIELVGDGRVHTYSIDAASSLARGLANGESVRRWFLTAHADKPIIVRSFRVLARSARFESRPWGTAHEQLGEELRSVLYMRATTTLEFDVAVPSDSPVFETGLAQTGAQDQVRVEVAVTDGRARTAVLERPAGSAAWADVSIDMSRWAGRRVRLSLTVHARGDAVVLWSSPVVRPRSNDDRTEAFFLILEDALRADRLSVYGGPVASPAHERVAAGGAVFERAFSQATQTRASVSSLMTSLLPSATGVWDFSDSLSESYVTLAEALRACGFATASFLQNGNAGVYAGLAQGFDVVFDERSSGSRAADLVRSGGPLDRWVSRQRGRPYFAYVHILDPHGPYDPEPRPPLNLSLEAGLPAASGATLRRDPSLDAAWLEHPTASARRALYDAEVASNDRALGTLLDHLDARGDLARATIAVIADHGEYLGEHGGMWRHHPPAHVEIARVPFLLRAPAAKLHPAARPALLHAPAAPSRRIREPVALLDVAPTLLELAHVDVSTLVVHGTSLLPVLAGNDAAVRAIVADEMSFEDGERRARGCGSFATPNALWLLSCTRDEDFSPDRLLPARAGKATALRRIDLVPPSFGVEAAAAPDLLKTVDETARRGLEEIQTEGLRAWRQMMGGQAQRIPNEPAVNERLRALGYAE